MLKTIRDKGNTVPFYQQCRAYPHAGATSGEVKMLATIPFSGFYESVHMGALEREGEDFPCADWREVFFGYAKAYAAEYLHAAGIAGRFESLEISTDRIFVDIPADEVRRMLAAVDPETLAQVAKARHATRSGFTSFYSPRVDDWGPVDDWDCNQIGTLIIAFVDDDERGWQICEDMECKGTISNLF